MTHFFSSSAAAGGGVGEAAAIGGGGGGGSGGRPLSRQLLQFLSTHPSISWSPLPPRCLPPHNRAMIPAITATIVITANTTTNVSNERWLYRSGSTSTRGGGGPTSGGSSLLFSHLPSTFIQLFGYFDIIKF